MKFNNIKIFILINIIVLNFPNCMRSNLLTKIQEIQELSFLDSNKKITEFQFLSADNPGVIATDVVSTIDEINKTIDLTVPYNTDVTTLIATFTLSGGIAEVDATMQESGISINDFTNPVTYTTTAADATTSDYVVTVTIALNDSKDLTQMKFLAAKNTTLSTDVIGTIDQLNKTVKLFVPYSTNVTTLVATFSITGTELLIGATIQQSDFTSNDYTNPIVYTVEAADTTTVDYTVTVTKLPPSNTKKLISFSFLTSNNTGLSKDIIGEINEATKSIDLYVPFGEVVTSLKASFTIDGLEVKVAGTPQVSGVTSNNFSSSIFYEIIAEDSSSVIYTADIIFCYIRDTFEVDISQWSINTSNNYTYQGLTSPGANGSGYCLEQTGQIYNHNINFNKIIGPTQVSYVSFYIKYATSGGSRGYFTLTDSSNRYVVFFAGVGSLFGPSNGSSWWGSQTIVLDKWYFIEFTNFNWSAKTHDYYCDGVLMYTGAPFREPLATEVKQINMYNWDSGTVYMDEVLVY